MGALDDNIKAQPDKFDEVLRNYQIRPIEPKTWWGRIRFACWNIQVALTNTLWGLYVAYELISNRVWWIGRDPSRKKFRPIDLSKPLKIGIVSEYYFPHTGGLTGDVHYAAVEMTKQGYDVKLITTHVDPKHNISRSKHGFEILRIGKARPFIANGSLAKIAYGFRLGQQVKRIVKEQEFDVIHIHCPLSPLLPMLFQRYADCPIVGHLHTLLKRKSFFYSLFRRTLSRFMQDFEGLVSVSDVAARPFEKLFNCQFKVIPNGVPVHHYTKKKDKVERFDDEKTNIFFIGRMEPRNGIAILLDAFKIIHKKAPHTRLILAGDGPMMPFFEDYVDQDLKPHVHFIGSVRSDKPNWFETGDINIVPTAATTASLGITLLESMSSGRPTVCSDIPAFRETVTPDKDVLVAKADEPEAFARQTLRLIENPKLGQYLAQNAVKKMQDHYSWTRIIERVSQYTNEVLEKTHDLEPYSIEKAHKTFQKLKSIA